MPHNIDRKPVYPEQGKPRKRTVVSLKKTAKGILNWAPLWVPLALLLWLLIPRFAVDSRLNRNGIATTARVDKTYIATGRGKNKMVKYYFYVGDSLYYGSTSPPDSVWECLLPHVPFEIVYEKGNPNNSNWAGYIKNK